MLRLKRVSWDPYSTYTISAMQSNNSMGLDADDKEVDKYMKKVNGVNISIQEYITSESKKKKVYCKI